MLFYVPYLFISKGTNFNLLVTKMWILLYDYIFLVFPNNYNIYKYNVCSQKQSTLNNSASFIYILIYLRNIKLDYWINYYYLQFV